jgi:hypothetical protein
MYAARTLISLSIAPTPRGLRFRDRESNLRHAAALALVGWYLLLPIPCRTGGFDLNAPLSVWYRVEDVYPTRAACESDKAALIKLHAQGKAATDADTSRGEALGHAFRQTIRASNQNEALNKSVTPRGTRHCQFA